MNDNNLKYKIAIGLIPKIGPVLARRLISFCGSIEGVFRERGGNLSRIPGIGKKLAGYITESAVMERAAREADYMAANNIRPFFYLDGGYPERLKHCDDAPLIIFVRGDYCFSGSKVLAVIGTRNATGYGKAMCNRLIQDLARNNHDVTVVSGLAYGIDICAHRSALDNNLKTVAVLGHGHGTIYPHMHKEVAGKIINRGALISEFLHDELPEPPNFVRRNRIIAGLSDAVVIVESGGKGGALITADLANSYNRDVFAFPGRITDRYSAGCNRLIKTNRAALIENYQDLEYILGWKADRPACQNVQKQLFTGLSSDESRILDTVAGNSGMTIDQVSIYCDMPMSKVSAVLLELEFKGLVKCMPGKVYDAFI
jgi:DNA processing protein